MTTNDELVVINTGGLDSTRADKDKKKNTVNTSLGHLVSNKKIFW